MHAQGRGGEGKRGQGDRKCKYLILQTTTLQGMQRKNLTIGKYQGEKPCCLSNQEERNTREYFRSD
jgi:hypothetical protein